MSTRVGRDNQRRRWAARQRADGLADAQAGLPPTMSDPDYLEGYGAGTSPCRCANMTAHPAGCQRRPLGVIRLCRWCTDGHNEAEEA